MQIAIRLHFSAFLRTISFFNPSEPGDAFSVTIAEKYLADADDYLNGWGGVVEHLRAGNLPKARELWWYYVHSLEQCARACERDRVQMQVFNDGLDEGTYPGSLVGKYLLHALPKECPSVSNLGVKYRD